MNDWIACWKDGLLRIDHPVSRFEHDQLMADTETFAVVLDGLILNKKELYEQHQCKDLPSLVQQMRQAKPEDFFNEFRGPFTGLFHDKRKQETVVFTNQTGDSAVFYHLSETLQVFSSNFMLLLDYLKSQNIPLTFDEKAAHWMLTFGYLIDDSTFVHEIKRLRAGKALYFRDGVWQEQRYHQFSSNLLSCSETEAIDRIEQLFQQAVRRCFDKDLEYGFHEHLADMSAGMDSRMVNCVAKRLGYSPITNISYSQTGSEEERLSKAMAAHLGNTMVFEALDSHEFVYDIDTLVQGNFGSYLYTGITGGARLLSKLDFGRFGAEHTGQLGDITIGTFVKTDDTAVDPEAVRLSHRLPLRYDPNPEHFENQDLYSLYTRGFMGAMSSWFIRKQFTYALSPFTDVDVMEFCYALPVAIRRGHRLYWDWVKRYDPDALTVPTSRKPTPVTCLQKATDLSNRALHKGLKAGRKLLFSCGMVPSKVRKDSSMNPYEYWYDTDPEMRAFFENYYREYRPLLAGHQEIGFEADTLYYNGSVLEKLMALTVLAAYKNFL